MIEQLDVQLHLMSTIHSLSGWNILSGYILVLLLSGILYRSASECLKNLLKWKFV